MTGTIEDNIFNPSAALGIAWAEDNSATLLSDAVDGLVITDPEAIRQSMAEAEADAFAASLQEE